MSWRDEIARIQPLVAAEYMTPRKATAIGSLWKQLRPRRIVEVGTFRGTGACYLGAMAAEYCGHVTTIDLPWTAVDNKHFAANEAERQLALCGVDNVTIVRRDDGAEGWWRDHFLAKSPPIDFVYIDGGHQWLNTAAQLLMAYAALRGGGWVCMDDLKNPAWPDVDLVWRKLAVALVDGTHRYEAQCLGFLMRR